MEHLLKMLEQARDIVDTHVGMFNSPIMRNSPLDNADHQLHSLLADSDSFADKKKKPTRKGSWKKPKDKPKRPLSAYNIFFQHERKEIIAILPGDDTIADDGLTEEERRSKHRKTHGKIGFAALARTIADKWKSMSDEEKSIFENQANAEKERYQSELNAWKKNQPETIKKPQQRRKKTKHSPPVFKRLHATSVTPDTYTTEGDPDDGVTGEVPMPIIAESSEANSDYLLEFWRNNKEMGELGHGDTNVTMAPFVDLTQLRDSQTEPLQSSHPGNFQPSSSCLFQPTHNSQVFPQWKQETAILQGMQNLFRYSQPRQFTIDQSHCVNNERSPCGWHTSSMTQPAPIADFCQLSKQVINIQNECSVPHEESLIEVRCLEDPGISSDSCSISSIEESSHQFCDLFEDES